MILLVAEPYHPLAAQISCAARGHGLNTTTSSDLSNLVWEVLIDNDGRRKGWLADRSTGEAVDAVVSLGVPERASDDEFAAAECLASWWALLTAFQGVVVNRPTRHGFSLSVDSVRSGGCAFASAGRWVLNNSWQAEGYALVRDAADMSYIDTVAPKGTANTYGRVLDVTECVPSRVYRIVIAGRHAISMDSHRQPSPELLDQVKSALAQYLPALIVAIVEERDGSCFRLLDIQPWPARTSAARAPDLVVDAVMETIS